MNIKLLTAIAACTLLGTSPTMAQTDTTKTQAGGHSISIGSKGVVYSNDNDTAKHEEKVVKFGFLALDLGFNSLRDKTDYSAAETRAFLDVPDNQKNENLFDMRNGKSVNVNLYPMLVGIRLMKTNGQKIYLGTGVGFQFYNFRFTKQVTYGSDPNPTVYLDSTAHFTKNKLAMTYISIPLGVTFKTRIGKEWLVYGFGATGGYRLASWMKQKSPERGKQKLHDAYNFKDFNACLTAEVGVESYLRLYASYQVTPLHENALEQYPLSVGIRLGGI